MSIHFEEPELRAQEPHEYKPGQSASGTVMPHLEEPNEKDAYFKSMVGAAIHDLNQWALDHKSDDDDVLGAKLSRQIVGLVADYVIKHHELPDELEMGRMDDIDRAMTLSKMADVRNKYLGENIEKEKIFGFILANPLANDELKNIVSHLQTETS